jgi:toxin ParE1/3/4
MDYKVIWSDEALRDIEAIATYIEKDSHFYASSVVTRILETTRLLEAFPFSGRVIPEESDENVREHFVFSFRIIYEISRDRVCVLAVVHGKRLLYPDFRKRIK